MGGGLDLPGPLKWVLAELRLEWPEAQEISMLMRSWDVVTFLQSAERNRGLAVSEASDTLSVNKSGALDAFAGHFDSVSGTDGYMMRSAIAEAAAGTMLAGTAGIVLAFKVGVLAILVDVASAISEAIGAAPETVGASLAAIPVILREGRAAYSKAQRLTERALDLAAAPLVGIAVEAIDVSIRHLDTRPIHAGAGGVHSYPDPTARADANEAYAARLQQLSHDSDHDGQVTTNSIREAVVAMGMEAAGVFPPGSVARAPKAQGDFTVTLPDGSVQHWDIKGLHTYTGPVPPQSGYDKSMSRQAYSDAQATQLITKQLGRKDLKMNVVMDSSQLTGADKAKLVELIHGHPEWAGRVLVY